uniref:Seminal fluid protein n=1 Tax=Nilaparvata lugens TaxID=108931 RepID=A0A1I9WLA5_NILLU|nr:seminal fluid protein [Nilaparvata lugens]
MVHQFLIHSLPVSEEIDDLHGIACVVSDECHWTEWCYQNKCDLPCHLLQCEQVKPNGFCIVRHHLPFCTTAVELQRDAQVRARGGCISSLDCQETEWCMNEICEDACQQLDCSSQGERVCQVTNHHPICKPKVVDEIPDHLGEKHCTNSYQCEGSFICLDYQCKDPCQQDWIKKIKGPCYE